ncbi:resuscitation-promoting factor [Luteimicrobium subarcticum]|uniref:Uncharacterized protein YabE (DUF348 family) n=1 Tax=Luteimicrobium subarcticum TaxID=620910 RepID=A0A2M8WT22_9MICO|nr:resuscitation-promoting factor [Luteimicrobium subarcticum]PJI94070.1 uncharacterized protein YabE (DUF348 family) [Luteimicrobium subarcticum]
MTTPTLPTPAQPDAPRPTEATPPAATAPAGPTGARHRRWPWIAAGTAAAVLVSGGAVYAAQHKTVQLDLAGSTDDVSTFAGTVQDLLDQQHVTLGDHDVVSPAPATKLREGTDVVVRYGHQVTIDVDGDKSVVWTTALDADEALGALAHRGDDVSLVANRSQSGGRTALGIPLAADGPVTVVADGVTRHVADASAGAQAVLQDLGIQVGTLDRVTVEPATGGDGSVHLVVQRVERTTRKVTRPIAYGTVHRTDAGRYEDLPAVVTRAGTKGVYTTTYRLVTVDGKVESTTVASKGVTRKPVAKIVTTGTKERPVVVEQPAATSSSSSSSSSSTRSGSSSSSSSGSSSSSSSSGGGASTSGVWAALARCESGGNPKAVNPAGYYGLYQFTPQTWHSLGGSGLPTDASAAEQTALAQKLQARSGWGQWPACAAKLGLL